MANGKIKLVKKVVDNITPDQSKRAFVLTKVKPVKEDYILNTDPGQEEEEVTTLENLRLLKNGLLIDSRAFRGGLQRINDLVGGASGMTSEEKEVVARTFAFSNPVDTITQFPNIWDRIWNGFSDFHNPAVIARQNRFRWAASVIYNTINPNTADDVITVFTIPIEPSNISLWLSYTEFGKNGLAYGDSNAFIMDYIRSTPGTIFENNGLREAITGNLQPVPGNLTVDQILDTIELALMNGIFRTSLT